MIVQDVYGNRYTYAGLGSVAKTYAGPAQRRGRARRLRQGAEGQPGPPRTPPPPGRLRRAPAEQAAEARRRRARERQARRPPARGRGQGAPVRPPVDAGGARQRRLGPAAGDAEQGRQHLRRLRPPGQAGLQALQAAPPARSAPGSWPAPRWARSAAPTTGKGAHLRFAIRPAGKGAPSIDPKPILDGWKLLEATSIYRASGRNALRDSEDGFSIGQIILMPKAGARRSACWATSGSSSTPAGARTSAPARSTAACWPPWPTWPSPASALRSRR